MNSQLSTQTPGFRQIVLKKRKKGIGRSSIDSRQTSLKETRPKSYSFNDGSEEPFVLHKVSEIFHIFQIQAVSRSLDQPLRQSSWDANERAASKQTARERD